MRFSESFIQELKSRITIDQLVGSYVPLKRAGSNLNANCPFHSERTPSFTVFPSSESFYCFGCGTGGDIITFMMKIENVDYPTAIEMLASRAGLPVPQSDDAGPRIDKKRLYEINRKAAEFFYQALYKEENRKALIYVTQRGLDKHAIRHFGVGYADESWGSLSTFMNSQGYSQEELKTLFLGGTNKDGRPFDYFRGRIMFPIIDISGNVIAFGGRTIVNDDRKYLNTNDTPVFKKGKNLYCLNFAKENKDNSFILCEGFMDVIALQKEGFINAVATLGTAITPDQARIMSRYAQKVYICYDSDEAGQRATKKAIDILTQAGLDTKIITFSGAKDPDEYIQKFGKLSFSKIIDSSDGHIKYSIKKIKDKYDLTIPEQMLKFINEVCKMLAQVYSRIEREIYIKNISETSKIPEDVLRREVDKLTVKHSKNEKNERIQNDINKSLGYGNKVNPEKAKLRSSITKEESLLGILLMHPEYLSDKDIGAQLEDAPFISDHSSKIYSVLKDVVSSTETFDISFMGESLSAEEMGDVMSMLISRKRLSDNSKEVALELIDLLKNQKDSVKEAPPDSDDDLRRLIEERRKRKSK